jgi:Protein of unknown function DUF262
VGKSVDEIPVAYDLAGLSTGVEADAGQAESLIFEPFDPAKIDVVTRTMTVDLLLARLRRGVLDLQPEFQRLAGVWNEEKQSKLIESLLLRIPLPTMYAAEAGEGWAMVDGVQRMSTIARFVDPELVGMAPLKLRGLEYLPFNRAGYHDLPGGLQTRIDETELLVHLIRAGTPDAVKYNIFARLNTGGSPLTRQELRHALVPGPARELLKRLADSEEFIAATGGSVRPTRMDDREMVLRFLAFRLTDPADYPRGDLDEFFREAMQQLNTLPEHRLAQLSGEFFEAMVSAEEIFGKHAFRKVFRGSDYRAPVNKALFESESVALAGFRTWELDRLRDRSGEVLERLTDMIEEAPFFQAISAGTGDVEKVKLRFREVERMLRQVAA